MIIVKLMGGLGNQMFQYAFGRAVATRLNVSLKFDLGIFRERRPVSKLHVPRNYDLDIFCLNAEFATLTESDRMHRYADSDIADKIFRRVFGRKQNHVLEPHFHFASSMLDLSDNSYIEGYWQSPKYFSDIEPRLREDFRFKEELEPQSKELIRRIQNSNSICVNVRRGDFVTNANHGFHGQNYIGNAEKIIRQHFTDYELFVFSDEIDWCQKNLKFEGPAEFVGHEYAGRKFQDYLRLMSACKHFIIPNSSFAWWAVWFNQESDRYVIAPKAWFGDPSLDTKDLIPESWIRV